MVALTLTLAPTIASALTLARAPASTLTVTLARCTLSSAALSTQPVQAVGSGSVLVGGVSSFGYSGTIAHALLQCALVAVAATGA